MKKFISLVLALLILTTFTVPALASDGSGSYEGLGLGQSDIAVSGKYKEGLSAPATYAVDIAWANMNFVYKVQGTNVWNPETHKYEVKDEIVGWEGQGTVLVANHSNVPVNVGFAFQAEANMTGLTGNFTKPTFQLAAPAIGAAQADVPNDFTDLTLSGGSLSPEQTTEVKIGTVTVSISAVSTVE